ncbi:MAG: pepP [Chlamydiales bacterium]|nr:pepP [Chlamydiales bacterium]
MNCYLNRIAKLRSRLASWSIDALLVHDPVDLFYLTGESLSLGKLLITNQEACLIVDGRYFEACQKCPFKVALSSKEDLKACLASYSVAMLGFDGSRLTYEEFEQIKKNNPNVTLRSIANPLQDIRAIKEKEEVKALKKSAQLLARGFEYLLGEIQEGVTERFLARQLEIFFLKEGGEQLAFPSIIAFGANGSKPHYHSGDTVLKKNQAILVDIGVTLNRYQSDMTRMVFFGEPEAEIRSIYEIVLRAKRESSSLLRDGVSTAAVDTAARQVIKEAGYGDYFIHSLGHGVGLDVHEFPSLRTMENAPLLKAQMAVTIEPGIYLPEKGGVRIEDTVLVLENGFEAITPISDEVVCLP